MANKNGPLMKVEDSAQAMTERAMKEPPICWICSGTETYDIIMRDGQQVIMFYSHGVVHLCKKCFSENVFWTNLMWKFSWRLLKLKRGAERWTQKLNVKKT